MSKRFFVSFFLKKKKGLRTLSRWRPGTNLTEGKLVTLDFRQELDKLIGQETLPLPGDGLLEAVREAGKSLAGLNKKQTELSMQMEELYDTVSELDDGELRETLALERKRAGGLLEAVLGLCDLTEDFRAYADGSGDAALAEQAALMWKNAGSMLERCGIARLGEEGQPLDPGIHSVRAAAVSDWPRESVAQVLRSGYRYLGDVERKAVIVISEGMEGDADGSNDRD